MINIAGFPAAALLEIAGSFAFWAGLRRDASPALAVVGVASLIGFAVVTIGNIRAVSRCA